MAKPRDFRRKIDIACKPVDAQPAAVLEQGSSDATEVPGGGKRRNRSDGQGTGGWNWYSQVG